MIFRNWRSGALAALGLAALGACATSAPIVYGPPEGGGGELSRELPPAIGPLSEQGPFQPNLELFLCPGPAGTNTPFTDAEGRVSAFRPLIIVDGIVMASVPVNDACMTSGFGQRFGRPHKGIDVQSFSELAIYSAAPGVIREVGQANGYGNYVLIDHGSGVFTRYAHFETFGPGIEENIVIGFGQPLGIMGNSGNATAIHLHFEILDGSLDNPRGGFGLNARDPLLFPEYVLEGIS